MFLIGSAALALIAITAIVTIWWMTTRPIEPVVLDQQEQQVLEEKISPLRPETYQPGRKTIVFSEREINGLINKHTNWGGKAEISLETDTIIGRIRTTIPEDAPFLAGKTVNIKCRVTVELNDGTPNVSLQDVTYAGISLPDSWLGEIKGKNLIETIAPEFLDNPVSKGIESINILPDSIKIRLAD